MAFGELDDMCRTCGRPATHWYIPDRSSNAVDASCEPHAMTHMAPGEKGASWGVIGEDDHLQAHVPSRIMHPDDF